MGSKIITPERWRRIGLEIGRERVPGRAADMVLEAAALDALVDEAMG